MSAPERMPGMISWMMTLKNACTGVQPRSSAASSRFGSSCPSFGITDRMTYGKLNVMCAMRSVVKPRTLLSFIICPANAKSSASETPVTISGFVSGIFVTAIVMRRIRPDMARMPMAAIVPSTVATSEAITATMTEFASSGSSTPSRKSAPYCANVKPFHTAISVPALNDATASTIIGIYRNRNTITVKTRLKVFISLRPPLRPRSGS